MAEEMLYTVKEVAKLLRTNPGYVYRLRDAGLLKFMKLGSLRVRKATLEAFLEKYDGMDLFDPFDVKPLTSNVEEDEEETKNGNDSIRSGSEDI